MTDIDRTMLGDISRPTKVLFAFTFAVQLISGLYEAWLLEPSSVYSYLLYLAHASILWWWLTEDSKQTGDTWPLDLGYFIYLAWPVLIPYHLFATRGFRGLLGILGYVGAIVAGWLAAVLLVQIYLWLYF